MSDDLHVGIAALERFQQFYPTAVALDSHVGKHHVDTRFGRDLQRGGDRRGFEHGVTIPVEEQGHRSAHVGLIFNEQDVAHETTSGAILQAAATGSLHTNLAPRSVRFSAEMDPP